jgi:hypothetical protein
VTPGAGKLNGFVLPEAAGHAVSPLSKLQLHAVATGEQVSVRLTGVVGEGFVLGDALIEHDALLHTRVPPTMLKLEQLASVYVKVAPCADAARKLKASAALARRAALLAMV